MTARFRLAALAAAALAMLVASSRPAAAQLRGCTGIEDPGYKILLDDIVAGDTGKPLKALLVSRLDANLEQLRTETGLPIRVLRCPNRSPSSPADFSLDVVQDLTARLVVLEVWGTTAEAADPSGAKVHDAEIGYALVPVRFYEFGAATPPGAFLVPKRATSVESAEALIQLVDQAGTLAAYAALGAGAKLLKGREYDKARTQLCKASSLLTTLAGKPGSPDDSLLQYVRRLAADTVTAARADASYKGPLKVLPVSTCQGAR